MSKQNLSGDDENLSPLIQSTAQLAASLGLSRWTVSRVLNGHPGVDPATQQRVRDAIAQSGFAPSPAARLLRGGRTGTVGVCLPGIDAFNLAGKIASLQTGLRAAGLRALLELSDGQPTAEEDILRHFLAMKVEGVVLFAGVLPPTHAVFSALKQIPLVMVDPRDPKTPGAVSTNRAEAVRLAVQHLLSLGHTRFAGLGFNPAGYYGKARCAELKRALKAKGLTPTLLFDPNAGQMSYEYGAKLAETLLALPAPEHPTALIAANDRIAIGAASHLHKCGHRLPEEFSLIGYDNTEVAAFARPALTTLDPQWEPLIQAALERLFTLMKPQSADAAAAQTPATLPLPAPTPAPASASAQFISPLLISPKLIIRESTAAITASA
jgi:DNA-binding LacI/PurR family transcriptional regulator